jgi:hypothetical protein
MLVEKQGTLFVFAFFPPFFYSEFTNIPLSNPENPLEEFYDLSIALSFLFALFMSLLDSFFRLRRPGCQKTGPL